ncbi:unnamed protein product [Amaranthus hypochondriacus]
MWKFREVKRMWVGFYSGDAQLKTAAVLIDDGRASHMVGKDMLLTCRHEGQKGKEVIEYNNNTPTTHVDTEDGFAADVGNLSPAIDDTRVELKVQSVSSNLITKPHSENILNAIDEVVGSTINIDACPPFQIGTFSYSKKNATKKRPTHAHKKMVRSVEQGENVGPSQVFTLENTGKRKAWDSDVEMVDSDWALKRSCMGHGVNLDTPDTVADAGVDQLREHQ